MFWRHLILICISFVFGGLTMLPGCQSPPHWSPCAEYSCGGHGTCQVLSLGGEPIPTCLCDAGYFPSGSGQLCYSGVDTSLCGGITCSEHGRCAAVHGQAQCLCDEGFQTGTDGISCVDPCDGVTCSGHGQCLYDGQARCLCAVGYQVGADPLTCTQPVELPGALTYQLTADESPDYQLGRLSMEMKGAAQNELQEKLNLWFYLDWHGGGIFRKSQLSLQLAGSGNEVTSLEIHDQYTEGKITRRRWSTATFAQGSGSATVVRGQRSTTLPLSYQGSLAPIPMAGGFDYPGWSLGSFSPFFYIMALARYSATTKGTQTLPVYWPESGQLSTVEVVADESWTPQRPVLLFPEEGIRVTYKGDIPQRISLISEGISWNLYEGAPADLNLLEPPTADPYQAPPQPTDHTETTISFSSADGTTLQGTLTWPQSPSAQVPALLLVGDLMAQDRHTPFRRLRHADLYRQLAVHLAHAGYASLRYDPRGRGASQGDLSQATLTLLSQDAAAALTALTSTTGVDPNRIVLLSHGTSSMVALSLLGNTSVSGYVALTPVIKDLTEVLLFSGTEHARQAGFTTGFLNRQRNQIKAVIAKINEGTYEDPTWRGLPISLWLELLTYDGTSSLSAYNGPLLAVRGDQDLEIPPEQLAALKDVFDQRETPPGPVTVQTIAGLTFLFSEGTMTDLWESAMLPLSLPSMTIDTMTGWLDQLPGVTP